MNGKLYQDTMQLVESINRYREEQKNEMINVDNEMCENYFAMEENPNDKRGSF